MISSQFKGENKDHHVSNFLFYASDMRPIGNIKRKKKAMIDFVR